MIEEVIYLGLKPCVSNCVFFKFFPLVVAAAFRGTCTVLLVIQFCIGNKLGALQTFASQILWIVDSGRWRNWLGNPEFKETICLRWFCRGLGCFLKTDFHRLHVLLIFIIAPVALNWLIAQLTFDGSSSPCVVCVHL